MNLLDIISDENFSLSYKETVPMVWDKTKLTEEFPPPEQQIKHLWPHYWTFYRRMLEHFSFNEIFTYREISELAFKEYGYSKTISAKFLILLWRVGKVRRFVRWRGKDRAHGVHYLFLPPKKKERVKFYLPHEQVREIRRLYSQGGISQRKLAKMFNRNQSTIWMIVNGVFYKDVL